MSKKEEVNVELITKQIFELENELLKSETRKSAEKISELLSEDFVEYCSSGTIYHYNKGDIFDEGSTSSEINYEIEEFTTKQLSNDCILATYKVIKHNELNEDKKYSLRSSIWKLSDEKWKMIFHQGTNKKNVFLK